ncbi:AraC family transcriptional regulator [Escherichia coli]|uniref:AraC family transcriptional regulator n=1 Tax=Escherichia coli TaxID=562 RepID=UPI00201D2949|nr:AraC family transcriptional regulator [Escherichia coli]
MCGYPSLQYFYSVFKKEYDVTPKEYRDRHSETPWASLALIWKNASKRRSGRPSTR